MKLEDVLSKFTKCIIGNIIFKIDEIEIKDKIPKEIEIDEVKFILQG